MDGDAYLNGFSKQLVYYRELAHRTIRQLTHDELLQKPTTSSNSIAIIVKHLAGNIFSRWTMMFETDGEKEWRNRDDEFILQAELNIDDLMEVWNKAWKLVEIELGKLKEEDLVKIVYIRNEGHLLHDALHRQLAHIAYHVGQIVYIGKLLKGETWNSLSIPVGKSEEFNAKHWKAEKSIRHYTDRVFDKH